MSPVPVDPFPDFLVGAVANGDQVDARFLELYKTLNPAQRGIDKTNIALPGVGEDWMAPGATGLAKGSFSAHMATLQSVVTGGVVPFDAEEWDVSGWHDTVTNKGRFTPQIAGYYRFSWAVTANAVLAADVFWEAQLQRNGGGTGNVKTGGTAYQRGAVQPVCSAHSAIMPANGTTDYFEIRILHSTGGATGISNEASAAGNGRQFSYFQAELIGRS